MSNYIMTVDFFGNLVRCETDGLMVSLNDLVIAGNAWRSMNGLSMRPIDSLTRTQSFADFKAAVSKTKGIPENELMAVIKGRSGRTMVHLYLAIYVAEQISPEFHVHVISTFIEGKLLEFRAQGGTEFKNLNAAIDLYLPDREGKDNKGCYINTAKIIRGKAVRR